MPHVHLVSSFRYPAMAGLDLKDVAKFLINAPMIARDKAPFFWTYLDKPADSTVLLTWQPIARLGTNFATDGFVWAPPEQIYKHDLGNGLVCCTCGLALRNYANTVFLDHRNLLPQGWLHPWRASCRPHPSTIPPCARA